MNRRSFFRSAAGLWLTEPTRVYSFLWDKPGEPLIYEEHCGIVTVGQNGDFLSLKSAEEWLWKRGGGTAVILPGHKESAFRGYQGAIPGWTVTLTKEKYV